MYEWNVNKTKILMENSFNDKKNSKIFTNTNIKHLHKQYID